MRTVVLASVAAAVDYLLLSELFSHNNTFKDQTFMHKGVGEKLVLGPIWDYDNAIGNGAIVELAGWRYGAYPWVERLYAHRGFRRRMARRWMELRAEGLRRHLMRTIDRGARQLNGGPQERNFSRWRVFEREDRPNHDTRTGAPAENYAQAVDYLKWWFKGRMRWITRNVGTLTP